METTVYTYITDPFFVQIQASEHSMSEGNKTLLDLNNCTIEHTLYAQGNSDEHTIIYDNDVIKTALGAYKLPMIQLP